MVFYAQYSVDILEYQTTAIKHIAVESTRPKQAQHWESFSGLLGVVFFDIYFAPERGTGVKVIGCETSVN